ncbi:MAG TPA: FHA domain-containing protein [Polyangia bacterium]|jgi:FOG: FHA domain|nr:FHA domain-containing protein [Polyangia bacterium]
MQKLLIEDDEGKTVAVPLIRDEITIGRQEGNTIRLSEQNVSRRHARLVRRQGALLLEDLSSYNGTKLNGAILSASAPLKDGDVILIGDYRMAIKEERPSAALPVAAHAPVASAAASSPAQAGTAAPPAAEVQDAIEAQPTIPLHSLVDEASALDPASLPPRLVIVGRFMAGREFMLDRPSLVIGRTSENDIVIEHKSISRHHARIVREGTQYYAVDLESANGVRVNGVDHDRVLLSPGDQIELGQVQLRFVTEEGGGEIEPGLGRVSKGKIFGIVGGVAVIAALVVAFVLSGGRSRPRPAPPAPPVVAQPLPPPPPPPPKETLEELLAAAKAAQANEKWDEALAAASKAVATAPDSSEAAELRKLVEDEKGNAERFATLKEAADKANFEAVLRAAGEIPETSVYKERASDLEKSARADYIKLHVDEASSKASVGACDEARSEAGLVLAVDRGNKTARWIVNRCAVLAKKASTKPEAKKPAQTAKPVAAAQSKPGAPSAAQAEPRVDPERLIQQAREAWLRGQYILAIDSARRALRTKPDLTSAYQIIAICSCSLHDSDAALRAYEKLDERNRQLVRSACQKNGISF